MFKKTIEYEDYEGNQRKEDFYFNLSKAELVDFLTTSGGYTIDKVLERLVKSANQKEIMQIFKDLIYKSYGEKSLDGRRFVKSKEVKDNFVETEAYSVLYMELVSDAKKAGDFIRGVIPKDYAQAITEQLSDPSKLPETLRDYMPDVVDSSPNVVVDNGKDNIVPIA